MKNININKERTPKYLLKLIIKITRPHRVVPVCAGIQINLTAVAGQQSQRHHHSLAVAAASQPQYHHSTSALHNQHRSGR